MSNGTKRLTFQQWQKQLDGLIQRRAGLTSANLPHLEVKTAFEAGESPPEYFADVVVSELNDLGFSVDDFEERDAAEDPSRDLAAAYLAATGDFF